MYLGSNSTECEMECERVPWCSNINFYKKKNTVYPTAHLCSLYNELVVLNPKNASKYGY